jgi:hypothetical protein
MISKDEFSLIYKDLYDRPIHNNNARKNCGVGRSQTFGIVRRRTSQADYSRHCRERPFLYKLLLRFGNTYVPKDMKWNSITVNMNFECKPHMDKGNLGDSWLVAFGDYTGGALMFNEEEIDVKYTPFRANFTKYEHWVQPFEGERYSLVYYHTPFPSKHELPKAIVRKIKGQWVFIRGNVIVPKQLRKRYYYTKENVRKRYYPRISLKNHSYYQEDYP